MSEIAFSMSSYPYEELWAQRSVVNTAIPNGFKELAYESANRVVEIIGNRSFSYGCLAETKIEVAEALLAHNYFDLAASIALDSNNKWSGWGNGEWARFSLAAGAALMRTGDSRAQALVAQGLTYLDKFDKDLSRTKSDHQEDIDAKNILRISYALAEAGVSQLALHWARRTEDFDSTGSVLIRSLRNGSIPWSREITASIKNEYSRFNYLLEATDWLSAHRGLNEAREPITMASDLLPALNDHRIDRLLELAAGWSILDPGTALNLINEAEEMANAVDCNFLSQKNPPGWLVFDRVFSVVKVSKSLAQLSLHHQAQEMFRVALTRSNIEGWESPLKRVIAETMAEVGHYDELIKYPYAELFDGPNQRANYRALLGLAAVKQHKFDVAKGAFIEASALVKEMPYGRKESGMPWRDIFKSLARVLVETKAGVSICSNWSGSVVGVGLS